MNREHELDPAQEAKRQKLRSLGKALAIGGAVLTAIGFVSFFSSFGSPGMPRYFWCAFLGLPMLGIGITLLKAGYLGTIARYVAGEAAPVAKDTFNYMAKGTQEGMAAIRRGLTSGPDVAPALRCSRCNAENDADASFCKGCGAGLARAACAKCGEVNAPDARFCDRCGQAIPV